MNVEAVATAGLSEDGPQSRHKRRAMADQTSHTLHLHSYAPMRFLSDSFLRI
jgi:hypothetical protein